jgi:hypothetical protein
MPPYAAIGCEAAADTAGDYVGVSQVTVISVSVRRRLIKLVERLD